MTWWSSGSEQAAPEYDQTFLLAPPADEDDADAEEFDGDAGPDVSGRRARGAARWARRPHPRCSGACGWATAAPRAFST